MCCSPHDRPVAIGTADVTMPYPVTPMPAPTSAGCRTGGNIEACGRFSATSQPARAASTMEGTDMPSRSVVQQKAAGLAISAKHRDAKLGDLKGPAKQMYASVSEDEPEEMAGTGQGQSRAQERLTRWSAPTWSHP